MQGETGNKKKVTFDLSVGPVTRKKRNFCFDLSMGLEKCPVDLQFREGSRVGPPHFKYVRCSVRHGSANLKLPGVFESHERCKWKCGRACGTKKRRCPCAAIQGGLPPYEADGLLHPHYIETVYSHIFLSDLVVLSNGRFSKMLVVIDKATREKAGEVEDVYEYCEEPDCVALANGRCSGHISRTFLKECGENCGCRVNCSNRVVQQGLARRLQVCGIV